jgi:hypothetical protein
MVRLSPSEMRLEAFRGQSRSHIFCSHIFLTVVHPKLNNNVIKLVICIPQVKIRDSRNPQISAALSLETKISLHLRFPSILFPRKRAASFLLLSIHQLHPYHPKVLAVNGSASQDLLSMHYLPIPTSLWCLRSRDEREGEGQGDGVVFTREAHPGRVVLVLFAIVNAP